MLKPKDFVPCGEIIKTHGTQGAVKINFSEHYLPAYNKGDWLFIEISKKPVPFFIQEVEYSGDDLPVFKLEDIDSPGQAQQILKKRVLIQKLTIQDWENNPVIILGLEGYRIYDQYKAYFGIVEEVSEQLEQFMLTILKDDGTELLLPCHPDLIREINNDSAFIIMEIPEGLDEL